jgi:uncharacterized protein YndB with AHSA1/START domain/predicted enzyme related to lactoylglutathione lyase
MSAVASPSVIAKPSLTLKRHLNAAPEKVYNAWTQPAQIIRWFGPDSGKVIRADTDVRVGGRYSIEFHTEDGEHHSVGGVYREVVPNQRLQFTWAWRTTPERESLVTIQIKPDGAGVMLTLIHEQFFDEAARDRHRFGWSGSLDKLERLFESGGAADPAKTDQPMPWSHGKFHWNELTTHDPERAKAFYAAAIGWTFEPFPMEDGGTYWIAKMGEQAAGGIFDLRDQNCDGVPEGWLSYIAVDDVDARVKKAVELGAKVMRPAFEVPGVGRIALLREPGGAGIAWITPYCGDQAAK